MDGVQLRLGFDEPTAPVTLALSPSGLRVRVECRSGLVNDAHAYLVAAGMDPELNTSGLTFPMTRFADICHLGDSVIIVADPALRPLLEWVENPPDPGEVAELELGADGTIWMQWTSANRRLSEPLPGAGVAALLTADLPFIASPAAMAVMRSTCHLPILVARCSTHRAGYIEIETTKPQMVEASGLPGLFRLDETTFGLPFNAAHELVDRPGYVWEGPPPRLEHGPRHLPPMPARLSTLVTEDLRQLVDDLAAYRTQLIVWDSGLGRRIFALAALVSLDAFPALVVAPPDKVWQWWRHAGLFSRTRGVDNEEADLRVITYSEFVRNPSAAYTAQTLLFDDVASMHAENPEVAAASVSIGGMLDCYLVGITDALPSDPKQLAGVMARLRPAEFALPTPLVDRYGTDVRGGLSAHVTAYVSRRTGADLEARRQIGSFHHSQVRALDLPAELAADMRTAVERGDEGGGAEALREMSSCGSRFTISPKVSVAVQMVHEARETGRRVAVLTDYPKTASLLGTLLRDASPQVLRAGDPESHPENRSRVAIVEGIRGGPSLSWFDEVIVVDYPRSYADLDPVIGSPADTWAPSVVTLLHLNDSIDDQLALQAARAEEQDH